MKFKLNAFNVLFCILAQISLCCIAVIPDAAAKVQGRANMQGSIIDTACAIDVGSLYQVIEIDMTSTGIMSQSVEGPKVPFSIHLLECSLTPALQNRPDWSHFRITFDGAREDDTAFKLDGRAKGVSLKLYTPDGTNIFPGVAMAEQEIIEGPARLDFILRLVSNGELLQAGEYHTTLRFKMDYF